MKRTFLLPTFLIAIALPCVAFAQEGGEEFTIEGSEETTTPTAEPTEMSPGRPAKATEEEPKLGDDRVSWQDIVVVIRKPFLKMNRFELMPAVGVTINDNMIRHYQLEGQLNYYLTDVLAVGLEGHVFEKEFLETYDLVARQDRRLPTLNRYNWGAALNFHYVPIYAKFAVFNKKIVHWETFFTAGIGFTQTEVIPRDPALDSWTNYNITPNVGITTRVFLADWITLNIAVRDYIFIDRFEAVDRTRDQSVDEAKNDADTSLVNHVMFQAGVSFWLPTSFRYTTFR